MEILILLIVISFFIKFLFNWIKITIFMWGTGIKKSSFKITIAYMIGKSELKDLQNLKD